MRIRYLGNSGFLLCFGSDLIIFDCYNPELHNIESEVASAVRTTVFVSHRHRDHYSPAIQLWKKYNNVEFVFSGDIPAQTGILSIAPDESMIVNGIEVRAFRSTDEGVSFLIETSGCTVFHAGDLNNWHWQQESTPEEAREAEESFLAVIQDIKESGANIDIAMFPVDPRMDSDYYRGALQFIEALRPKQFIPMHFGLQYTPHELFMKNTKAQTRILNPGNIGEEHYLNDC